MKRHSAGYVSDFTHIRRQVELVYREEYDTYQEAFRRERQFKKWTVAKKKTFIAGDIEKLKKTVIIKVLHLFRKAQHSFS